MFVGTLLSDVVACFLLVCVCVCCVFLLSVALPCFDVFTSWKAYEGVKTSDAFVVHGSSKEVVTKDPLPLGSGCSAFMGGLSYLVIKM